MSLTLTNTHISNDSTRKCLVYVDKNGHYEVVRYILGDTMVKVGTRKFKHIESANRAVAKWIKK